MRIGCPVVVDPPPAVLQAAKPAANRSSNASKNCGASCCARLPDLLSASTDNTKDIAAKISKNQTGRLVPGNFGNRGTADSVCGVVAMDSVTICETSLGVMVVDEKEAVASGGSPLVTLNLTGLE